MGSQHRLLKEGIVWSFFEAAKCQKSVVRKATSPYDGYPGLNTGTHRWWVDRYTGCHIGERCLEVAFISGSPTKWVTWALSQCPWGLKISVMNVNVNSLQWILAHTKMGRFEPTQILFRESYLWLPNAIVSHLLPCLVIILYLDCFCILCLRNDLWKSCVLCSVHLLVLIIQGQQEICRLQVADMQTCHNTFQNTAAFKYKTALFLTLKNLINLISPAILLFTFKS